MGDILGVKKKKFFLKKKKLDVIIPTLRSLRQENIDSEASLGAESRGLPD